MGRQFLWGAILLSLLAGCPSTPLELDQVGNLTFTHTINANGNMEYYAWNVPAEDVRAALANLEPRAPEYRRAMLSSSQSGTVQYRGKSVSATWSRVKQGEKIYLVDVGRRHYMLREPHAGAFEIMLMSHGRRVTPITGR